MGARLPAEWAPHCAVWIGFPSDPELWREDLILAQEEVAAFAVAVHAGGRGEAVWLVAADEDAAARAHALAPGATVLTIPFFDIWLRDTGPLVRSDGVALDYRGNGWGGKYPSPLDDALAAELCAAAQLQRRPRPLVLEGGAIDVDGAGLLVTTEACLLNPNRNGDLPRAAIEAELRAEVGAERVVWLGEGLTGDHTDGHVDNLARFVAPGVLAVPEPEGGDDPNADIYGDAWARAEAAGLRVVPLPSPGRVEQDGAVVAASYMNFYVGNATVAVPAYGRPNDEAAVKALAALFPDRRVVPLRAEHILTGGGSLHCISQQLPVLI